MDPWQHPLSHWSIWTSHWGKIDVCCVFSSGYKIKLTEELAPNWNYLSWCCLYTRHFVHLPRRRRFSGLLPLGSLQCSREKTNWEITINNPAQRTLQDTREAQSAAECKGWRDHRQRESQGKIHEGGGVCGWYWWMIEISTRWDAGHSFWAGESLFINSCVWIMSKSGPLSINAL